MATVLQNASVFTGLDDGVISNGTVVIEDGLIASIEHGTPRGYGPDTTVVDCSGKTITPGIIDAHAHLVYHELTSTYDIDLGKVARAGHARSSRKRRAASAPGHHNDPRPWHAREHRRPHARCDS